MEANLRKWNERGRNKRKNGKPKRGKKAIKIVVNPKTIDIWIKKSIFPSRTSTHSILRHYLRPMLQRRNHIYSATFHTIWADFDGKSMRNPTFYTIPFLHKCTVRSGQLSFWYCALYHAWTSKSLLTRSSEIHSGWIMEGFKITHVKAHRRSLSLYFTFSLSHSHSFAKERRKPLSGSIQKFPFI